MRLILYIMKIFILAFLLITTTSVSWSSCVEGESHAQGTDSGKKLASALSKKDSGSIVSLKVAKMSCMSCATKIRKALKTDHFIDKVDVDETNKSISFACPSGTCSLEEVKTTLKNIGYETSEI